jgi:hypothetical protein
VAGISQFLRRPAAWPSSLSRVRRAREVETVIDGIGAGPGAGIAVTVDAGTLLVSGLDPESRRDRVYVLDTNSRKLAQIVEPFDSFSRAAGLHRAHNANVFAWADSEANDSGTVYRVRL